MIGPMPAGMRVTVMGRRSLAKRELILRIRRVDSECADMDLSTPRHCEVRSGRQYVGVIGCCDVGSE
jgi:hypothetical protein